jgi:geranylgeranylglyceryl phosphate synthase family protein
MKDFDFPNGSKTLALLLDPDKAVIDNLWLDAIAKAKPDFILIGGSQPFSPIKMKTMIETLKDHLSIPLIGFPGDKTQVQEGLDALMALSVIQSTDSRYILDPLFQISDFVVKNSITTYYTPYIILGQGGDTAVEIILKDKINSISDIQSFARYLNGLSIIQPKVVYLEAGSGSKSIIDLEFVTKTKSILKNTFLFTGGGIRSKEQAEQLWLAGADCVVVGNWIEQSLDGLLELAEIRNNLNSQLN